MVEREVLTDGSSPTISEWVRLDLCPAELLDLGMATC
jgi:hypothetical protein